MMMIMAMGIMLTRVLVDMIRSSHCRERESCALETLSPAALPVLDILMRFERGPYGRFLLWARCAQYGRCFLFGGGRVPESREYGTGITDDSADSDITFTGWTNYNPGK